MKSPGDWATKYEEAEDKMGRSMISFELERFAALVQADAMWEAKTIAMQHFHEMQSTDSKDLTPFRQGVASGYGWLAEEYARKVKEITRLLKVEKANKNE